MKMKKIYTKIGLSISTSLLVILNYLLLASMWNGAWVMIIIGSIGFIILEIIASYFVSEYIKWLKDD